MRSAVFLFSIGLYFVKIQSRKIVSTSRRFSSKKPEYALKIIDKKREQSHGRDAPDAGWWFNGYGNAE